MDLYEFLFCLSVALDSIIHQKAFEASTALEYFDTSVSIKSKANSINKEQIKSLANEIIK